MLDTFQQYIIDNNGVDNWKTLRPIICRTYWDSHKDTINQTLDDFTKNSDTSILRLIPLTIIDSSKSNIINYEDNLYDTPAKLNKLTTLLVSKYNIDLTKTYNYLLNITKKENKTVADGKSITATFIEDSLETWAVKYDRSGILVGNLYGSECKDIKLNELLDALYQAADYRIERFEENIKKDYISAILNNTLNYIKDAQVTLYRDELRFKGNKPNLVPKMIDKLLELGKIEITECNRVMMMHLLWSIKRKIFGKEIPMPVFFVFFGKKMGVGKSYMIENILGYPFRDKVNIHARLDQLLTTNDTKALLYGFWLLDFQELSIPDNCMDLDGSIKKSVSNTIKSEITSPYVSGREMYTDTSSKIRQGAVFCSSANKHIYNVIHDADGMRRYWEFGWGIQSTTEIDLELSTHIQQTMVELYQNIDENFEDGYYAANNPLYPELLKVQESYRYIEPIEQFCTEKQITLYDGEVEGCDVLPKKEFYSNYFEPWMLDEGRSWRLNGMVNAIKDHYNISPKMYGSDSIGSPKLCYFFTVKGATTKTSSYDAIMESNDKLGYSPIHGLKYGSFR